MYRDAINSSGDSRFVMRRCSWKPVFYNCDIARQDSKMPSINNFLSKLTNVHNEHQYSFRVCSVSAFKKVQVHTKNIRGKQFLSSRNFI